MKKTLNQFFYFLSQELLIRVMKSYLIRDPSQKEILVILEGMRFAKTCF